MKLLTIKGVHGHHLGVNVSDIETLATLRTYVEFAVRGERQRTSISGDMTSYPLWPDVLPSLKLPEGSDGVLEVLRTNLRVCIFSTEGFLGVMQAVTIMRFCPCVGQGVPADPCGDAAP